MNCLKPLSKEKTVILVTHQISYVSECDECLIMENGSIAVRGKPSELLRELS
jgi:ABC-type transport system involved in cytochrome bd biosynthesis fused ATPase/permease subunit